MHRKSRSMVGLWAAAIEAQSAMWTTLAIRVPLLATGTMSADEQTRMVSEKFEAWSEGARDTTASVSRMMLNPVSAMQSPDALFGAMLSITSAAATPYQKRVTSNARRLQKRKA